VDWMPPAGAFLDSLNSLASRMWRTDVRSIRNRRVFWPCEPSRQLSATCALRNPEPASWTCTATFHPRMAAVSCITRLCQVGVC
jgi:hypothetical protein